MQDEAFTSISTSYTFPVKLLQQFPSSMGDVAWEKLQEARGLVEKSRLANL